MANDKDKKKNSSDVVFTKTTPTGEALRAAKGETTKVRTSSGDVNRIYVTVGKDETGRDFARPSTPAEVRVRSGSSGSGVVRVRSTEGTDYGLYSQEQLETAGVVRPRAVQPSAPLPGSDRAAMMADIMGQIDAKTSKETPKVPKFAPGVRELTPAQLTLLQKKQQEEALFRGHSSPVMTVTQPEGPSSLFAPGGAPFAASQQLQPQEFDPFGAQEISQRQKEGEFNIREEARNLAIAGGTGGAVGLIAGSIVGLPGAGLVAGGAGGFGSYVVGRTAQEAGEAALPFGMVESKRELVLKLDNSDVIEQGKAGLLNYISQQQQNDDAFMRLLENYAPTVSTIASSLTGTERTASESELKEILARKGRILEKGNQKLIDYYKNQGYNQKDATMLADITMKDYLASEGAQFLGMVAASVAGEKGASKFRSIISSSPWYQKAVQKYGADFSKWPAGQRFLTGVLTSIAPGTGEGATFAALSGEQSQTPTPAINVVTAAAMGGVSAGLFQGVLDMAVGPQIPVPTTKGIQKKPVLQNIWAGLGYAADPTEFIGDNIEKAMARSTSRAMVLSFGSAFTQGQQQQAPLYGPRIGATINLPASTIDMTNLQNNAFDFTQTQQEDETIDFSEIFNQNQEQGDTFNNNFNENINNINNVTEENVQNITETFNQNFTQNFAQSQTMTPQFPLGLPFGPLPVSAGVAGGGRGRRKSKFVSELAAAQSILLAGLGVGPVRRIKDKKKGKNGKKAKKSKKKATAKSTAGTAVAQRLVQDLVFGQRPAMAPAKKNVSKKKGKKSKKAKKKVKSKSQKKRTSTPMNAVASLVFGGARRA